MTSPAEVTARGRARAEALMVDACLIQRPATTSTFNETTGKSAPDAPVLVYAGPCRFQFDGSREERATAGERQWTLERLTVSIPVDTAPVRIGDMVTAVSSDLDAELVNRKFRVAQLRHKTHLTARRLGCEEVAG